MATDRSDTPRPPGAPPAPNVPRPRPLPLTRGRPDEVPEPHAIRSPEPSIPPGGMPGGFGGAPGITMPPPGIHMPPPTLGPPAPSLPNPPGPASPFAGPTPTLGGAPAPLSGTPAPAPRLRAPSPERLAATARQAVAPSGVDLFEDPSRPKLELPDVGRFQPREPRTWEEAGVDDLLAEQIVCRYLLGRGAESGRIIANELAASATLLKDLLESMKQRKLVTHRTSTAVGDFVYELTDVGRDRAVEYRRQCSYVGPLPVPFAQYLASIREQTIQHVRPTPRDLDRAFSDLLVSEGVIGRLGPAISSGRALFLYGSPGNGKTSIAERITRCFGDFIWIPQTLYVEGHIVKLYDPGTHEAVDANFKPLTSAERLDRRWIRIRRPTVVAGGELTLEMLEIQESPYTHICEAPLQLKANSGTLVIDDFGRQRIEPQVLLNRWIFPLERRVDFLKLPDGRKINVPFDPILVFSTNIEPRQLMDEAFLRRIPYKIAVLDPTEEEFRALTEALAQHMGVEIEPGSVQYLIDRHYKHVRRPLRFCHPRDLLQQVAHEAAFQRQPARAGKAEWDRAAANYFGL